MEATTKALIETIGDAGYSLMTGTDSDGNTVAEATDLTTSERFIVRGDDLYTAAVELAQQVRLDLKDG